MDLKRRVISGLWWAFSQQFSIQLINFLVSIVLTRVLLPSEFGLIGMLTLFMAVGNLLMDGGLTSSLIRTPNPDRQDYSTVFFTNVAVSIFIYIVLFFSAQYIAVFFNQLVLVSIIRVYCLSLIVRAFGAVHVARATKEMNFKLQMKMEIPSVIISGITGIVLAFLGFGVWSLVWMNLLQSVLFTLQFWLFLKWRPFLSFDLRKFRYHFRFGYHLTFAGLLESVYQNLFNLIIGKYFSAAQLGFYVRAQSLRQLPVQNISEALNRVTYPLFSAIQNDDEKLKNAYKKLMMQVMFWLCPVMLVLIVFANPLIRFLFTDRWLPCVPYFRLLCIAGITYPLHAYNLNILKVKGRSDLFFRLEVVKKVYTVAGIIAALPFGIYGLLYFQIISSWVAFYVNSFYSGRMIKYPFREQIADILPLVSIAFITAAASWYIDHVLISFFLSADIIRLLTGGTFFLAVYLGLSQILKIPPLADFKTLMLKI